MFRYTECPPGGKPDHENIDDDATELAVSVIATRYRVPLNVARLLCELAHIGRNGRPASGGRA